MLKGVAFALAALIAWGAAAAGDRTIQSKDGLDFFVPAASPVTLESKGHYAEFTFKGAFTLSGTFTYGYVHSDSADDIITTFVFVPDRASVRNLPHWPGGTPDRLTFSNEEEFLKAMVPAKDLAALNARRSGSITGRVTVRADTWHTILACGDAYYAARFVSVIKPARLLAPQPVADPGDC